MDIIVSGKKSKLSNNLIAFIFCTQKAYPSTVIQVVQTPRISRLVVAVMLCFVLESVQESIIYP